MGSSLTNNKLKLLQINLQRCKVAASDAIQIAYDRQTDIIFLQEPYTYQNKIAMFGSQRSIYQQIPSEPPKSGFIIVNDKIGAHLLPQHCNNSFTTISVNLVNSFYIFISFYCPPSGDLEASLALLADSIQQLQAYPILVCSDFNANSHTWHSPVEDPRGYQVEEFLTQFQLTSLNTSTLPTFSSTNGESWINICLGSNKFVSKNIQCYTTDIHSASDHNYIEVVFDQSTPLPSTGLPNIPTGTYTIFLSSSTGTPLIWQTSRIQQTLIT
ncbi:uncharacterized protein LOC111619494 [Centruroides sculpturatus]|uniref:uncharacterized protein LOC111619494 n=1 Tax=Centruroides sculpturatus TaxID=218467 RepID=UPI000C6D94A1|nr:uncharacterized protein LOC111619494 [Centruroides sculpturatus]